MKWHGYIHINGTIQVKPIMCEIDTSSPFVTKYFPPFDANDRDEAINYIKNISKDLEQCSKNTNHYYQS